MANSRARVLTALRHEEPERVPVDFKARPDVEERLISYLGLQDKEALLQKLGADIRYISSPRYYPDFEEKANGVLNSTSENRGQRYIFHEDGSYENALGVRYRTPGDGKYDEWLAGPFSREEEPNAADFDWPSIDCLEAVESIRKKVERYKAEYVVVGGINYPFKTCWQMRGMENFFCDMLINEEFALDLWRRSAVYEKELGLRMIRAGVDILAVYGDIAMQQSLMYSLETWRKIDKPIFADMIAAFKKENPQIFIYYHSDGNMEEVIPDLIEIGVDVINPIQPECMDVNAIKEKYGRHITLHGTVSIQEPLTSGTIEDVRREVEQRLEACGKGGGFILCPSNLIQSNAPLENVLEIYRAAGSYGG